MKTALEWANDIVNGRVKSADFGTLLEIATAIQSLHRLALDKAGTLATVREAIFCGGYDISPMVRATNCGKCGMPVVCIPDGLPMCEECGKVEKQS